jgi:predicted esterase
MQRRLSTVVVLLLSGLSARGQFVSDADRSELGRRLRAFERALDRQTDEAVRRRSVGLLRPLTFTFFSGRAGETARLLDAARRELAPDGPVSPAVVWAEALAARPSAVLIDRAAGSVGFKLAPYYEVKGDRPPKAEVRVALWSAGGKLLAGPVARALDAESVEGKLPLKEVPEGDHVLRGEVVADRVLARWKQSLAVVDRLDERLKTLQEAVQGLDDPAPNTDRDSLRKLTAILTSLHQGKPQETGYPAARLLKEAEEVRAAIGGGRPYYGQKRVGQFWLRLPDGRRTTSVRLQAPAAAGKGVPLPLVIAMHGVGGSENLFFEAHGTGLIARLCAERGWLLVAPANGLADGLVDEVDHLYPVDRKRVFLVGHSLGAAQVVSAAGLRPGRYAAVGALGGGGRAEPSEGLKELPFFIGCGSEDFALAGARGLHAALERSGVRKLRFREYEGMEHLVVVQLSLPEVFAFFDEAARRP